MYTAEYEGVNSFLVDASSLLLKEGVRRETRGRVCWELPEPFMFKIKNPTARIVTIPQRKWNPILPFAESLWLASGRNDLNFIRHYLKKMDIFSDDGLYLRGGYGPRLRNFTGAKGDYHCDSSLFKSDNIHSINTVDQFYYIIEAFNNDPFTRRAIIDIGDPPKDCFNDMETLKDTKDYPCTRLLHFQRQPDGHKLDLTVYMRSNDVLWGSSAVNIFNYTFMQEYFCQLLGLTIGNYYHITNNLHYYDEYRSQLTQLANIGSVDDIGYTYKKSFNNLNEFDKKLLQLENHESNLRLGNNVSNIFLEDEFFFDWHNAFEVFNKRKKCNFKSPQLNIVFKKYYNE